MLFVYKILYFICSIFKFLTKFSTLLLLLFLHTFSHTNIKTFQCAWTHTADQNHWLILFYFIGRGAEGGLGTLSNSCTYIFHTVIHGRGEDCGAQDEALHKFALRWHHSLAVYEWSSKLVHNTPLRTGNKHIRRHLPFSLWHTYCTEIHLFN